MVVRVWTPLDKALAGSVCGAPVFTCLGVCCFIAFIHFFHFSQCDRMQLRLLELFLSSYTLGIGSVTPVLSPGQHTRDRILLCLQESSGMNARTVCLCHHLTILSDQVLALGL